MGKYILKRLGYMLIVLLILSFLMFLLYNAAAGDRAYVKAYGEVKELKNITAEQRNAIFEETYLKYKRAYGTDNPSKIVQYLRWMGFYPYYDGQFNGLVQGNFGYSEYYRDDVLNVVKAPMKNTIFINIFATILALAITIPLGIHCAVRRGKTGDKIMQVLTIVGYSALEAHPHDFFGLPHRRIAAGDKYRGGFGKPECHRDRRHGRHVRGNGSWDFLCPGLFRLGLPPVQPAGSGGPGNRRSEGKALENPSGLTLAQQEVV